MKGVGLFSLLAVVAHDAVDAMRPMVRVLHPLHLVLMVVAVHVDLLEHSPREAGRLALLGELQAFPFVLGV